jgi:murein DD-endopeptidase MepM/ murein hydrolase activator NlpD
MDQTRPRRAALERWRRRPSRLDPAARRGRHALVGALGAATVLLAAALILPVSAPGSPAAPGESAQRDRQADAGTAPSRMYPVGSRLAHRSAVREVLPEPATQHPAAQPRPPGANAGPDPPDDAGAPIEPAPGAGRDSQRAQAPPPPDAPAPDPPVPRVPRSPPPGAGVPVPGARYAWPLLPAPVIATRFREPPHPYGPGHRGVDLVGTAGQPVLAARAGTVVFAGPVGGRGVVSVHHDDGLRTTYEPVRPTVPAGAVVGSGAVIGLLEPGHPSCSHPACLHWGVRRGRLEYLDPLVLLRPPEVRLLPVPESGAAGFAAARGPPSDRGAPGHPAATSSSLPRNRPTRRVCSWHTRDSVTPSRLPISASVRFST